jgi:hypothetical protein
MRFARPRWRRLQVAATSLLLSGAVLAALSQAGKSYVWCLASQQVMPHSCCSDSAGERTSAPAVTLIEDDCCQARSIPLLDDWTQASRGADPSSPLVAVLSYEASAAGREAHSASPAVQNPTMRAGPPQSRVLAQLMVLRI